MKTKDMVLTGMLTAVLAVLSIIQIPMPSGVPITLQTFAVALCGYVLGKKKGTLATVLYVVIGTIGIPVFAGMTGGFSCLIGPTGGFIYGFIFLAFFSGAGMKNKNKVISVAFGVVGLAICHLLGALQFSIVTSTGFGASIMLVSVPYLLKDVLSVIGAMVVAIAVRKGLAGANLLSEEQVA